MKLIQLILGAGVLCSVGIYLRYLRSSLIDRALALLFAGLAFVAILFPQLTILLAEAVGVGRGTDLTFYIYAVASSFAILLLYSRLQRSERRQTELVRALSIMQSKQPLE